MEEFYEIRRCDKHSGYKIYSYYGWRISRSGRKPFNWSMGDKPGGHCYKVIASDAALLHFFEELVRRGVSLDGVDFHAHGVSDENHNQIGIMFDDRSTLNYLNIRHFFNRNFDTIFSQPANITFYGCEVGRHYTGEKNRGQIDFRLYIC